mgnify:CR=1 FL=1
MPPHGHPHHGPHHHHHHRHHADRFLDALGLLVDAGKIPKMDELIRYADLLGEPTSADFLRECQVDGMNIHLALEQLRAHLRRHAHKEERDRLRRWHDSRIVLVFPLPPHVHEPLLELPDVAVVVVPGHHLPPHLHGLTTASQADYRGTRKVLMEREVIVLEGVQQGGTLLVEPALADLLDGIALAPPKQIAAHIRPHSHHGDVPLDVTNLIRL